MLPRWLLQAIMIPEAYPLEAAGPVMCAGITMYDPLIKLGAGPGSKVGVVGLGGLGVMGIKLAKAMGCSVTAISRSGAKRELALSCGADGYIASGSAEELAGAAGSFDLILNTIPVYHDYDAFTRLLGSKGKQCLLGLHKGLGAGFIAGKTTCGLSKVTASMIGGIQATQAVMDLCAEHNIVPELKVVPCENLNEIYRMLDTTNDAGVRYVLDIGGTLNADTAARCTAPPADPAPPEVEMTVCGTLGELLRLCCCCKCR
jgi:uncharacterized zinc-type alcohol dehydrogenase-like protein